jgi:erythromycin esterase-like protein
MTWRQWHVTTALALAIAACSSGRTGSDVIEAGLPAADSATVGTVRSAARLLTGNGTDYDPLLAAAANARVVFLGEQTHGTHEFYRERARITQRLVLERGFRAIALEADWPEIERVNRYIHGEGSDRSAQESLGGVSDFPLWMWRNTDVRDLVEWLRTHNAALPTEQRVSVYGLDVYSLYPSAEAVVAYLETVDPEAAGRARGQYACFAAYRPDPQRYGAAATGSQTCEAQAAAVLTELQRHATNMPADPVAAAALFSALRNAHSVANAEEYFRGLYTRGVSTWNVRDQRMEDALVAIGEHLGSSGAGPARIVVWAHNTHAGDARATESGESGEHNVGQLIRQRFAGESMLVGFFTHHGTVMAAPAWGQSGRVFDVRPALPGSYSDVFHAAAQGNFLLMLGDAAVSAALGTSRLERAVGVVYVPANERQSHYFLARLAQQFDAAIFFDVTNAVTPLP